MKGKTSCKLGHVHRFEALDGWRGICAMAVALNHLWVLGHFRSVWAVNNFHLFVDFFFVLSGFVISHAYLPVLGGWRTVAPYLVNRFGRLYPLHLATLSLMVAYEGARLAIPSAGVSAPFGGHNSLAALPANVALLQGMGVLGTAQWNAPSWSISVEFFLYVAFALVLAVGSRRWLSGIAAIISLAGATVIYFFAPAIMDSTFDFGFFRGIYGFFLGVLLYGNFHRIKRLTGPWGDVCEYAVLILIGLFLSIVGRGHWSMLSTPLFAVAIWVFAQQAGAISRLLCSRIGRALGVWSYSIYLWHFALLYVLFGAFKILSGRIGWPVFVIARRAVDGEQMTAISFGSIWANDGAALLFLALVLVVSAFSYRLIERPGQRVFGIMAKRLKARIDPSDRDAPTSGVSALNRSKGDERVGPQ